MRQSLPYSNSNRAPCNWLIYDINHVFLRRFSNYFIGHLYDVGCGEMPYRSWLVEYADRYTGVDWSSTLHELKADIVADLNRSLPIDDQVADPIISLSIIEHLLEP